MHERNSIDPLPDLSRKLTSPWRHRAVIVALVTAAIVRSLALAFGDPQPYSSIRETYFATAAALASGYGYITETPVATENHNGFAEPTTVVAYMKEREAAGGRVDSSHPFPKSAEGWLPGTRHPFGYGTLIYFLYLIGNYTGAIWSLHVIQILADSVACVFVFIFARNLLGARVGAIAAWLYALCPPTIFLSVDLLPDAFHGFFMSLVLALLTNPRQSPLRAAILSGAALGIGCHFRTEYILLPGALFFAMWANCRRFLPAFAQFAGVTAAMLLVLLPWAFWMKSAIGEFRFTATTGGGTLYECLGEDTSNPEGIVNNDGWINGDALRHGFTTAWSADADRYYGRKFREYVRKHPRRYLRTILVQRLPLTLATPYETGNRTTRAAFNFTKYRIEEGLSRWGTVARHPIEVLRYMWPQILMSAYSGALTVGLFILLIQRRKEWRTLTWLVMPWLYPVATISILKCVEPRNLATTLPVLLIAIAALIVSFRKKGSKAPNTNDAYSARRVGA